tara:strand:+ start:2306 stop:2947 length:642 start_codon:yes stop_codon:yes gene_type:complete
MKVLTEEEHEKNCFQFKPIPFTARDRILQPTGTSTSVLTNNRSTFIPISAPASVIDLALSQEQLMGSSRKAYMTGYKSVIEAIPKKQFEAFEEEQVEEQADIPDDVSVADTASTRALPERKEQDLEGFTVTVKRKKIRPKLKLLEKIVEKGEADPRVKQSLDILKAQEKGLTNLEKRRGRPSAKPDAEAMEDERPRLRGRPKKDPLADVAEGK